MLDSSENGNRDNLHCANLLFSKLSRLSTKKKRMIDEN